MYQYPRKSYILKISIGLVIQLFILMCISFIGYKDLFLFFSFKNFNQAEEGVPRLHQY